MTNNQLFVSYSRRDKAFVNKLVDDLLRAGFNVWRDTEAITPGTPNWERVIRDAIKGSVAIVLVASPNSNNSEYVQGELGVARHYKLPVYPIWANGDDWINCIPLNMSKAQYVDGREGKYGLAMAQLTKSLNGVVGTPEGNITIALPAHDTLSFDLARFPTFQSLVNQIFMFHLAQWYAPYTYGMEWVLGNVTTRQVALPWAWLNLPAEATLHASDEDWAKVPPSAFNVQPGSHWGVWDASKFPIVGVAVQSDDMAERLRSQQSIYELIIASRDGALRVAEPDEINVDKVKHRFFIGLIGPLGNYGVGFLRDYLKLKYRELDSPTNRKLIMVETT